MADDNIGGTPLPEQVDLNGAIAKFLPGMNVKIDDTFGILFYTKPEQADDLTEISGIGPVNAKALNAMGVYRFSQIASWSAPVAAAIGEKLEFPGRIEREDWVPQAIRLAKPATNTGSGIVQRSPRPQVTDYETIRKFFKDEPVRVDQDLGYLYNEAYHPDDLTRISGVGDVLAKKLNESGIYRFKQIANWNTYNVEEFGERLDFPGRIEREEWIPQARRLMAEDAAKVSASGLTSGFAHGDGDDTTPIEDDTTASIADDITAPIADDDTTPIEDAGMAVKDAIGSGAGAVTGAIGAGAAAAAGALGFANRGDDTTPIEDDDTSPIEDDMPIPVPPAATPSKAKSDTAKINIKGDSGLIQVEDSIFKQQTMPINLDNPKGETSKLPALNIPDAGTPIEAKLSKSKSDTSKIDIGDFSPDDAVFKGQTMAMDDILESDTARLQAADTLPIDEFTESDTERLQAADTTPMDDLEDSALLAGKSSTLSIPELGGDEDNSADEDNSGKGKPKLKRPSQLKPKTIKRPSTIKPTAKAAGAGAVGIAAGGAVEDTPKTVKLKRPGAPAAGSGDTPKTVKLKKAPTPSAPVSDSAKKTVKLQKRPAPSQGGLKLNRDSAAEGRTETKKKKKKRKARGRFGVIWLIVSLLTFLLAAVGIMTFLNSAYPEDRNNNQALSWTFPFKGYDANIPFPKPSSTGTILPPKRNTEPLPLPSAAEGAVNETLDSGDGDAVAEPDADTEPEATP